MGISSPHGVTRRGAGFYFWATIFGLLGITATLVVTALLRPLPGPEASAPTGPAPISITQEHLTRVEEMARQAGRDAVAASLDDALDRMFDPVHAKIPDYTDFHYSVWGQYTELLSAAAETTGIEQEIGSLMRNRLFDGFETRHSRQMEHLRTAYQVAVAGIFEKEGERLADETGSALPHPMQLAMADAQRRMIATLPAAATSSMAATAAAGAIVKPIASKIVASTAVKAGAKGVGLATGIGGAAAAGAAGGSFLGPVGAIVGWLAVDYAVVKLDEYFNRDDFEAELRAAIDTEKARLGARIRQTYGIPAR